MLCTFLIDRDKKGYKKVFLLLCEVCIKFLIDWRIALEFVAQFCLLLFVCCLLVQHGIGHRRIQGY